MEQQQLHPSEDPKPVSFTGVLLSETPIVITPPSSPALMLQDFCVILQ